MAEPITFGRDSLLEGRQNSEVFSRDGFVLFPQNVLCDGQLDEARTHLERVFRGEYDLQTCPSKAVRGVTADFSFSSPPATTSTVSRKANKTFHMINVWHCDSFFRSLATSAALGRLLAALCGWEHRGVRLAQDQVWVKPPLSGPLSFHRDTTYFDFLPKEVVTVWFTFDDTMPTSSDCSLGPLEYCVGSHLWGLSRRGSVNQFFDPDYRCMLRDAATREVSERRAQREQTPPERCSEVDDWCLKSAENMEIVTVQVQAGGFSVHNGATWHGSGPNDSKTMYRRGIGIHYLPGDAVFDMSDLGKLWKSYCTAGDATLPEEFFPWVFRPEQ